MTDEEYFRQLESDLQAARDVAERARAQGRDPEPDVEIPAARDMADRVEKILGIDGVAERIRELEGEMSREEAALEMVEDFVEGSVGDAATNAGKIEAAVRTAVALLTEGVVAAPIEGIDLVEILENDDGTEFVNVYYAGPIRSAGGTAQALSVLVADYARSLLGLSEYKARDDEVERYAEEVGLYADETGLQYTPKGKESKFIAENMPIMLDGEATGDEEVSGYRDLERFDTNNPRGGMCLVLAEGIALKAPKIQRYTRDLEEVDWPWLQDLIDGTIGKDDGGDEATDGDDDEDDGDGAAETDHGSEAAPGPPRAESSGKFLRDLIAGRPVFGHPSEPGGFRLRYGRARNHGHATAGVHPATMHLVDDFLAPGTQVKTERPGKAAGIVPVDTIEGPTVRLANGDVRRIDDPQEALTVRNGVEAILDLGEYLVNYGEFVENNHELVPASYTVEWWVQEFERTDADVQAMRDAPDTEVDLGDPSPLEAIEWAMEYDVPLHPDYTYLWHDLSVAEFEDLADAVAGGRVEDGELRVPDSEDVRRTLETLLVEHAQPTGPDETAIAVAEWRALVRSLGLDEDLERGWDQLPAEARDWPSAVKAVDAVAPFEVRERAPTRVGNRMGRPEKSESRELSPAVHALFPIGEAGGSQRDVSAAADHREDRQAAPGHVEVQVGRRACTGCDEETFTSECPECGSHTRPDYRCPDCDRSLEPDETGRVECDRCEVEGSAVEYRTIDVKSEFRTALETVGERENAFDVLKGVKGLSSTDKVPEPIEKGVLRAKHGVSAFKDGTVRYDMTDLPVTAVRPEELDVTVGQFRELGYETDVHGRELRHEDQLVELNVQDVVLSNGAAEHMMKTADFVDQLLEDYYGLEPFYELEDRDDLVGELVFGMAPHTSAATVARVVGFTSAAVGYAHPYFHAAKRRNCFHPEIKIWYEDEAGQWHHERIKTVVEDRLTDPREDDFGTLIEDLEGDVRVPSVTVEGNQVAKPVSAVSKHPAPDHLVEIITRDGRELTVTPEHEVHVYDPEDEAVVSVEARDLEEGDSLLSPGELDVVEGSAEYPTFDLLEEFLRIDEVDDDRLMIKGLDKEAIYTLFEEALADDYDEFYALKTTAEHLGMNHKTLSNYLSRESFPVSILVEIFDSLDDLLAFVPDDVTLGMKRDRTEIDRHVEVDERVATLLGYYAAEGFSRAQETSKGTIHQTTICDTESETRGFFLEILDSAFGVDPYVENHAKVTVSGRLLRTFFDTVLDAGVLADTKRVPETIFDAPDEVVGAYLGGYLSGDGTVDSDRLDVSATTVSPELKEDLLALFSRLGIGARAEIRDPEPLHEAFPEFYDEDDRKKSARRFVVRVTSEDAVRLHELVDIHLSRKRDRLEANVRSTSPRSRYVGDGGIDGVSFDPIESVEYVESREEFTYCLTVEGTHSLIANDVSNKQCDGDEDCVMLLMDGLLNFSKCYLPDQRGGSMDAPLVMSSRIDPSEIDDEAHNVDVVDQYPLELYEASRELAHPETVDVEIGEDRLDTDRPMSGFDHTHDTTDIAMGPDLSAYKTLGDMAEKMDSQLELARKLRSVDETDVAERIIEYHFLPDLLGNLRAFSSQEVRCLDCGEKFRRMPLTGACRECKGDVNLTVHEGSVTKYLETAITVADEYGARKYTKQRLEVLERSIERVFEDDTNKQSGIADFM